MTLMPRPHPLRYGQFDTLQDMLRGPLNQVCVCVGGGGGLCGWHLHWGARRAHAASPRCSIADPPVPLLRACFLPACSLERGFAHPVLRSHRPAAARVRKPADLQGTPHAAPRHRWRSSSIRCSVMLTMQSTLRPPTPPVLLSAAAPSRCLAHAPTACPPSPALPPPPRCRSPTTTATRRRWAATRCA